MTPCLRVAPGEGGVGAPQAKLVRGPPLPMVAYPVRGPPFLSSPAGGLSVGSDRSPVVLPSTLLVGTNPYIPGAPHKTDRSDPGVHTSQSAPCRGRSISSSDLAADFCGYGASTSGSVSSWVIPLLSFALWVRVLPPARALMSRVREISGVMRLMI